MNNSVCVLEISWSVPSVGNDERESWRDSSTAALEKECSESQIDGHGSPDSDDGDEDDEEPNDLEGG